MWTDHWIWKNPQVKKFNENFRCHQHFVFANLCPPFGHALSRAVSDSESTRGILSREVGNLIQIFGLTEISREIRTAACNIFQESKVYQNLPASAVIPFIDIYAGALLYITICSLEFSAPDSEVEGWLDTIFLKHKEPF